MKARRGWWAAAALAVVAAIGGMLLYPNRHDDGAAGRLAPTAARVGDGSPAEEAGTGRTAWADPLRGRVGEGLLAPGGTARRDLVILQGLLAAWRSNAPGQGNPVGNNREITATLTGRNPWKREVIPPDHPAINADGELCDRWGTPLFFHQLSGERMELRSSGPDRERYTDDDVVVTP